MKVRIDNVIVDTDKIACIYDIQETPIEKYKFCFSIRIDAMTLIVEGDNRSALERKRQDLLATWLGNQKEVPE